MAYKFILFDLDDTLYPRGNGLMREIGRRIQVWLVEHLAMSWDEASRVRKDYFQRYGTTLGGLVAEREIDARGYLDYVHDLPLETYIQPNPALGTMLETIPLRCVIYTNADAAHAWRVLNVLGVADHFEQVIGIEEVGLLNKPCQEAYERALLRLDAWGPACVMVEDSTRNLRPAKALGMTTVLVDELPDAWVDFVVSNVLEVGDLAQRLLDEEACVAG